ncbi:hypothetical protein AMAG_12630 [Allomyces macrogynus ATCC 38327]|uniref:Uncharacterized protein n=1 Tax=Allomyces macrogynus (strain ATCC 38327) TaxID=578462 RepID=A0A0L0SZD7_ALLM3|nr:hypothetical protein AMAG_12630 [Allomyces macrogynus ATCC 38327]|eukprot:KNE67913.1 hypothetical protein AMAG_12630 [Allomyces macrogynus ATCC 38327]
MLSRFATSALLRTNTATPAVAAVAARAGAALRFFGDEANDGQQQQREFRPRRQFNDGEQREFRPRRQFNQDGEQREFRPRRQFNNQDGEQREYRPRRQFNDGEQREFRPRRQFNNNQDGEEGPRMMGQPAPADPVERLRFQIENRQSMNAFRTYERLTPDQMHELKFGDHVRLMAMFRQGNTRIEFSKLETIFKNMEARGFDIPAPVYETMVNRAWRQSLALCQTYFDKMIAAHGQASGLAYASLMNAMRHEGELAKTLDLVKEAQALGIDMHPFKPILMDVYVAMGDRAAAETLFQEYVAHETQNLNVAKAFTWKANLLRKDGKYDEAVQLLDELPKRGVRLGSGAYAVLGRIALAKGNADEATSFLFRAMELTTRDTNSALVVDILKYHMDRKDYPAVDDLLAKYGALFGKVRDLRFYPYFVVMTHFAVQGQIAEARRVFDNIPFQPKWMSPAAVGALLEIYLVNGDKEGATKALNLARRMRFASNHPKINEQFIAEGGSERVQELAKTVAASRAAPAAAPASATETEPAATEAPATPAAAEPAATEAVVPAPATSA